MDDSGSSSIGLDLNPDMMTTQTSVPTVVPKPIPLSTPGVIDITPGAPDVPLRQAASQHVDVATLPDNKVVDITPSGPISKDLLSDDNLKTSYPLGDIIVSPIENFPQGITPSPDVTKELAPLPVTDISPSPISPPELVTPPGIEVILPNPTTQTGNTPSSEELAKLNPLYENPDTVVLNK